MWGMMIVATNRSTTPNRQKARKDRDVRTGVPIKIPSKKFVTCKAGKELKLTIKCGSLLAMSSTPQSFF